MTPQHPVTNSAESGIWDTLGFVVISHQHSHCIYKRAAKQLMNGHANHVFKNCLVDPWRYFRCHGAVAAHGELKGAEHVVIHASLMAGWLFLGGGC